MLIIARQHAIDSVQEVDVNVVHHYNAIMFVAKRTPEEH